MSRVRIRAAAAFAAVSLALAWALTGFGTVPADGPRLAQAGSPVGPAMIALIVALVLGGIVFLVVGQVRRRKR